MTEDITFIEDIIFSKMTKKEKSNIPQALNYTEIEISKLVIVPTNKKFEGYRVADFFAYTPKKGWWRPMSYDCFRIVGDYGNIDVRHNIIKGDFENGGVQVFGIVDEHHKAYMKYGGEVLVRRNIII